MMEEIEAKVSAINCKQYYQLGNSYGRLQDDIVSECGSEEIDTIVHRYDPPSSTSYDSPAKSLAEEMIENKQDSDQESARPEPPPDILVSSNCRPKVWPQLESENSSSGVYNDAFSEDWDMILDTETAPGN